VANACWHCWSPLFAIDIDAASVYGLLEQRRDVGRGRRLLEQLHPVSRSGSGARSFEIDLLLLQLGVYVHCGGSLIVIKATQLSDLTNEQRLIVEQAFRERQLLVLCCTTTLAIGVNLPCERVVVAPFKSDTKGRMPQLTVSLHKQMIGRAARDARVDRGVSIFAFSP